MGFKFRREGEPFIGGQDAHYWRWSWGEFSYGELGEEESGDFNKDRISWLLLERNIWLRSLAEIIDEEASFLDLGCGAGKNNPTGN